MTPGMRRCNAEKRRGPPSRWYTATAFHFPPITDTVVVTAQVRGGSVGEGCGAEAVMPPG
ncbi:hypothetical protein GCM10010842_27490 [Deinococcus daejeonensis]|uniref:Uncharacterized protein n=1 Tax=Deinococcus daejeonensis TaxID=1007098 RepID=A0ABQ2J7T6_9DEIO|nr:hypothetical protein GCM10010842_27490 [Deinococcus daejeonensis]